MTLPAVVPRTLGTSSRSWQHITSSAVCRHTWRLFSSSVPNGPSLQECYDMFYMDEFSSPEELRQAYDVTVKRFSSNIDRVKELDAAYYQILKHRFKQQQYSDGSLPRGSYLRYEGFSSTVPRESENQQQETKASGTGTYRRAVFKHSGSIDKMVDTLINKSFDEADTQNLTGFGKPFPKRLENPYIDNMQVKLNQIMINNDCATDWIEVRKEIKERLQTAKTVLTLQNRRLRSRDDHVGVGVARKPAAANPKREWEKARQAFVEEIHGINKRVDVFNMAVPIITMQRMRYDPNRELEKLKKQWANDEDEKQQVKGEDEKQQRHDTEPSDGAKQTKPGILNTVKDFFGV